jgi:hypothetical protein
MAKRFKTLLYILLYSLISTSTLFNESVKAQEHSVSETTEEPADSTKRSIIYRALNQKGKVTFLAAPILSYTPETDLQFGVGGLLTMQIKDDSAKAPSYMAPWFTYSLDKQILAEVFGTFFIGGTKHQIDYETGYFKLRMPFMGIGNDIELKNQENFLHGSFRLWANYQYRFKDRFLIGGRYHIDYSRPLSYESGRQLDTLRPLGFDAGLVHGLGLRIAFDSRDDVYFPYKGSYAIGSATFYPKAFGSDYQFALLAGEYRSFINIKNKVILASQMLGQIGIGNTPFYMLPRLGGLNVLRGYPMGAFRDQFLFYMQGELRVPVDRFIFSGFFGSGIVGAQFKDYFKVGEYNFHIGGGTRFRPFPEKNIMARLDFGFWKGTYGVYFVFNEAF